MPDMFYVTVIGMLVVFALLMALMYIVVFQSRIIAFFGRRRQKRNETSADVSETPYDNDELIAVITAAVSSMTDTGNGASKIRVTSFKRIGSDAPVWNYASRRQNVQ